MLHLKIWRQRLYGDWLLYLLFPLGALCLPLSVRASGWFPGAEGLAKLALWAGLAAMLLAYSPWRSRVVWLIGLSLGLAFSMQFAADIAPPRYLLQGDIQRVYHWVRELVVERRYDPDLPLSYSATYLSERIYDLAQRVWQWVVAVQQGAVNADNAVLQLAGSLLIWLLTWNLGFHLFRTRHGLAGLVPLGIALLASVSFTGVGTRQAQAYLGASLLLWLWSQAGSMELIWAGQGTGVEPQWRRHLLASGIPLAGLVFVIALAMPYKSYDRAVYYFWDHMGHRIQTFYKKLDRAFAGRNPLTTPASERTLSNESAGLAPHDIRGGVSASDQPILLVRTSDPGPDTGGQSLSKRYWRERTYDQYTGYGWASSESQTATFGANAPWKEVGYPYDVLTQTFTLLVDRQMALAVNEPVALDDRYTIITRGAGDLAAISVEVPNYTVTSLLPNATTEQLRGAEGAYADWVAERYLALPEIPDRIGALAQEVVQRAQATTRYDKARAIEGYLRDYAYDEDLAPPPWDADVVEYFLFTARRGYCDYSATAMVVMLRSVDVAARYASGYGQGIWDPARGAWVVSGRNAHAWVEVYFPGYGWIEFEPTPSQAIFVRASAQSLPAPTPLPTDVPAAQPSPVAPPQDAPPSAPLTSITHTIRGSRLLSALTKGGLLMLLLGFLVYWPRFLGKPRPSPDELIGRSYGRLRFWGRLVGAIPQDDLTPREWLQSLQQDMLRCHSSNEAIPKNISVVRGLYERALYSDEILSSEEGDRAWAAWKELRRPLSQMLLSRHGRQRDESS